ncbi:radical SAM/SPASM domain-containing protein [Streptomyces sp. NPDC057638]|uniref:radical SAM/SPASM domain-containing protein n=1 Tax=Streptomyces sp. NPDC057638 TaxID=3346190 RepID=UPI0036CCD38C
MSAIIVSQSTPAKSVPEVVELEITGSCQLRCVHCFAESGPWGDHGAMTASDWRRVIDESAALGVRQIQLIGGEPTLHPAWPELVEHAPSLGLHTEIYSNLFHVRPHWWQLFSRDGVTLATSYYSDRAKEHEAITARPGSYQRTRTHITEAVRRGVPLRVGIVSVLPGQRVVEAQQELEALGVTRIRLDRTRRIGRASAPQLSEEARAGELCGRCGNGQVAVLASGDVAPCVMARWLVTGNVRDGGLASVISGGTWAQALRVIPARESGDPCDPDCKPASDGSDCSPAERPACEPKYEE